MPGKVLLALALAVSHCEICAFSPCVSLAVPICPSEPVLELLHEAAFHLDQGDDDNRVGDDLAEANRRLRTEDSGAAWARQFIARMEATVQKDAASRRFEAEVIRADLHETGCLPKDLHRRFHQRLPPVGLPRSVPPEANP